MANPLQQALQRDYMEDLLGNKLGPLKPALSHIGLYMGIVIYTAIGAKVRTPIPLLAQHLEARQRNLPSRAPAFTYMMQSTFKTLQVKELKLLCKTCHALEFLTNCYLLSLRNA